MMPAARGVSSDRTDFSPPMLLSEPRRLLPPDWDPPVVLLPLCHITWRDDLRGGIVSLSVSLSIPPNTPQRNTEQT